MKLEARFTVSLDAGVVRDLLATRDGETDQPIEAETFDFLLGYGASFFDSARGLTEAKRPARLTGLTRHREPFANPGHMVPVLVNRHRTKAAFDVDDPSISLSAQYDHGAKQRKAKAAADKAEFDALRSGKDERRS